MASNPQSKNRIGSLVEVPSSRITQWAAGERLISDEKAFELGEALRKELNWSTSGVEFLWACGYWSQILEIFKQLASDGGGEGTALAAALYAWLPSKMWDFEIRNIEMRFTEKFAVTSDDLLRDISCTRFLVGGIESASYIHIIDNVVPRERMERMVAALKTDPGAREASLFADADDGVRFEIDLEAVGRDVRVEEFQRLSRSADVSSLVKKAWEQYKYPGIGDPLNPSHDNQGAEAFGVSSTLADVHMYVIDALIEGANRLGNEIFPTYSIPPIWRMLSGWVYEIDQRTAAECLWSLPDNFINVPDAIRRREKREDHDAANDSLHIDEAEVQLVLEGFSNALRLAGDVAVDGGSVIVVHPAEIVGKSNLGIYRFKDNASVKNITLDRPLRLLVDDVPSRSFRLYVRNNGAWSTSADRLPSISSTYAFGIQSAGDIRRRRFEYTIAIHPTSEENHINLLANTIVHEPFLVDDFES